MASLLRQIVAGPRAKHDETGLDLCYVTSNIIATSGPSQAYPQRAYRNPLDRLVAFLDSRHGGEWAIWEFRAEGTGYPDDAVYHRIRHYPWPDHHPPPFRLVPMIVASMRNWLSGGHLDSGRPCGGEGKKRVDTDDSKVDDSEEKDEENKKENKKDNQKVNQKVNQKDIKKTGRVVVVHCKAGKGRSGTMACSYLISECGWTPEDALARFTERRMRPKFGAGVSIPSQLRWISYVDRWTKGGKKFVDRDVEIVEIHTWGLRHGVKISVEGFSDEGKKIKVFHTFTRNERIVVEGDAPGGAGIMDLVSDMVGYGLSPKADRQGGEVAEDADFEEIRGRGNGAESDVTDSPNKNLPARSRSKILKYSRTSSLIRSSSDRRSKSTSPSVTNLDNPNHTNPPKGQAILMPPSDPATPEPRSQSQSSSPVRPSSTTFANSSEPGGQAVVFKPTSPIRIPGGDVNVALERRNRAPASMGLMTLVTAVAHVWFNAFFEGNGPEQGGRADDAGVFEIEWDLMDGIKGSSRKGTKACERIAVVWRAVGTAEGTVIVGGRDGLREQREEEDVQEGREKMSNLTPGIVIDEPGGDIPVPQMKAADWKGGSVEDPEANKHLGLRTEAPDSAAVSKASSVKSQRIGDDGKVDECLGTEEIDGDSLEGVKTSGPLGEEHLDGMGLAGNPPTDRAFSTTN